MKTTIRDTISHSVDDNRNFHSKLINIIHQYLKYAGDNSLNLPLKLFMNEPMTKQVPVILKGVSEFCEWFKWEF